MSHRLMRIASLATVAGWAIALSAPTALGQPIPPSHDFWKTDRWQGSATCVVTGHSPSHSDYTNQETHKWEIIPVDVWRDPKDQYPAAYYNANWTVTGSGRNADFSWTTNGYSWMMMQFWLPSIAIPGTGSTMNIGRAGAAPTADPYGTTVTKLADGTISKGWVYELTPFPTVVATPGIINIVQGNSSWTINGSIFFNNTYSDQRIKEPDDGINTVTCSWDFEYKPTVVPLFPGKLCLPSMPDCDKPFVLKPPLKKSE